MINFKREERKRQYCVNVYLCVSSEHIKIKNRIKYNRSKYKLYVIEISKTSDINIIKSKGYDKNLDRLYILSEPNIDKYFKKKPSLWQSSIKFYSEESCLEDLNIALK